MKTYAPNPKKPGLVVVHPVKGKIPLEGMALEADAFVRRRVKDGDLVEVKESSKKKGG